MSGDKINDDEYVARLLKQDAVEAAKKYSFVGLDAFHAKRSRPDAPKPNTNFLRHIIRQTDSHNAALLAREAKDSRARLRQLDTAEVGTEDRKTQRRGRLRSPVRGDQAAHHERRDRHRLSSDEEQDERSHKRSRHERHRSRDEDRGHRRRHRVDRAERSFRDSDHRRESEYHSRRSTHEARSSRHEKHHSHKRGRPRSVTRSPSPPSSRHHNTSRHRRRAHSPSRRSRSPTKQTDGAESRRKSRAITQPSPTIEDDSDPLEAIVGPLPPPKQPAVRSRGRGAHKSDAEGINARFSAAYDPALDNEPLSNNGDQWGDAVEAYRDRQRWKQQGAERLKAAGFSDEQVRKWERGDEKTEEDVRWTARGQSREWDRGKVVDADGDIGHRATWVED